MFGGVERDGWCDSLSGGEEGNGEKEDGNFHCRVWRVRLLVGRRRWVAVEELHCFWMSEIIKTCLTLVEMN